MVKVRQEYQSQFYSSPTNGMNLLQKTPTTPTRTESVCESILVTHLVDAQEIIHLASFIGVTTIQLPGNIAPEDIFDIKEKLPYIKVIKSLHVVDDSCMGQVKKYMEVVDAIELDTIDIASDQIGGTGKTHDWNISSKIVQEYKRKVPIILAGGLHSDNVEHAIQTVKPFGVDVSSGVKDSKSIQDNEKLELFISKAKYADCART